jgi:protein required for attachment to host cells
MKRALIVTVDAARARLCLYQEQAKPGFELTEYRDLDNPGRRMRVGDMTSDSRPGVRGSPANINFGGPGDDHRDAHVEEMDSKFAKHVVETIEHVLKDKQMAHLILAASPKMLGALRAAGAAMLSRKDLEYDEVPSDLSGRTLAQLHDHVAQLGLVPGRQRLAAAR